MTLDPSRVAALYSFMTEREAIRLRRLHGLPREQWTSDPILQTYSFTNVKREFDRTTRRFRLMYRDMISACPLKDDMQNACDLLTTCAVFRFFGTEHSAEVVGPYTWARPDGRYNEEYWEYVSNYGMQGDLTFTSAYMVRGDTGVAKYESVIAYCRAVQARAEQVVLALHRDRSWRQACEVLVSCHGVGSFMAKEILLDYLMVTEDYPDDWRTWTPVGPGGIRGAARVKYGRLEKISEAEALEVIREIYAQREQYWPKLSPPIQHTDGVATCKEMVSLDLTDIQWCLCEWDKRSRCSEGGRPRRLFRPTIDEVTCG